MAAGKWTILVVNDDGSGVRQVRFSRVLVRGLMALSVLVLFVWVSFATQALIRLHGPQETLRLEREQNKLQSQLGQLRGRVGELGNKLETLSHSDQHFRLLAGLDPLDEEVKQAGIGGPDARTLRRTPLWQVNQGAGETMYRIHADVSALLRRAYVLSSSRREAHDSLQFQQERLARTPSIQPVEGTISSGFTRWRFHPILQFGRAHEGLDITAQKGTPIVAAAKGRVRFVGRHGEFGLMVEIDHGFNLVTRYAHTSKTLVHNGQAVQRGDTIALVGASGLADGPHLHYEVLSFGRPVNPRQYLMATGAIPD